MKGVLGRIHSEERKFLTDQLQPEVAAKNAIQRNTVWQALGDREVLKLCVTFFLWITGFWGGSLWIKDPVSAP